MPDRVILLPTVIILKRKLSENVKMDYYLILFYDDV